MELRTEIEIEAPPDRVWDALVDFDAYRDWNPFISSIRGKLEVGARLVVDLSPPESRTVTLRPKLLVVDPGRELRWKGHFFVKGLFDGEHFFKLSPTETGTRLVQGEDFSGLLVQRMGPALTKTARGFVAMNQALRRRLEA